MSDERKQPGFDWSAGSALPPATLAPLTRTMLALYAGGSGDHNPLHIDTDFARNVAKMDDVIGHGMLTMALVARYVTSLSGAVALRNYSVRFLGMSKIGDRLHCSGRVSRIFEVDGKKCAELELQAARQSGEVLASGSAVLSVEA